MSRRYSLRGQGGVRCVEYAEEHVSFVSPLHQKPNVTRLRQRRERQRDPWRRHLVLDNPTGGFYNGRTSREQRSGMSVVSETEKHEIERRRSSESTEELSLVGECRHLRRVKAIEQHGLDGPLDRWRAVRDTIHADVCARGFDVDLGSFVQSYDSKNIDASLLLIPAVGFLPATDPRVLGTIAAVERELLRDGFVARYPTHESVNVDGLVGREGAFLACSFWLVDAYTLVGRRREAIELFERLLAVSNDVGLLAEEYDPISKRQVGNFPQAFSHVALVNSACNLTDGAGSAVRRA